MNAALRTLTRLTLVGAASTAVLFGTTACSLSSVPADSVETEIVSQLGAQGVPIDNSTVDCAEDLDATVGTTQTCEFRSGGQPVGAVVTVTSVDGSDVAFDIGTEARPIPKALLQDRVSSTVVEQVGIQVDATECAGDLPATTGGTVSCTITSGGEPIEVDVNVTQIDGGAVDFEILDA